MKEEILRAIDKCEEMGWITINPNLNKEAIAGAFLDIFKDMSLKRAMEIFFPRELF